MGDHVILIAGVLCALFINYHLIKFVYPYLRPSGLHKYLGNDAYAVVTGSTDGIGKAVALALAHRGYNIVLHGRNADKLNAVETEILASNPGCKIVRLLHDGSSNSQMDSTGIQHLPITILVNNVGVGPIKELAQFTSSEIDETITLNTAFPSQLTRILLPQLNKHPSLILNITSYAGVFPPPYLAVYAGTKAYNTAFSISLSRELENTEVIALITGSVHTGSNTKPVTFMRPSADTYAKHILGIVGCGKKSIMPYWPHALQSVLTSILPEKMIDHITKTAMQKELNKTT